MLIHKIPLESFLSHGDVSTNVENEMFHMTTNVTINTRFQNRSQIVDTPIKSYVYLSDKYKLPFKIDMKVKIDSPALYLIIGRGHIGIGTGGGDNRRITDILGNDNKTNSHVFDNDIPIDEFVDISVVYGKKSMWVYIKGELRCFSNKDPYIKALKKNAIPDEFKDGFDFAIACDKRTQLTLKTVTVSEYESDEPVEPTETLIYNGYCSPGGFAASGKSTVEQCIQGLSPNLQKEVLRTDEYFLKDMKTSMKFKRTIEGAYPYSKIKYKSPLGLTYFILISGCCLWHNINWNGETYHTDRALRTRCIKGVLDKLAEESPEFANKMFFNIKECSACGGSFGGCMHFDTYEYNGTKKGSCGGNTHFKMLLSDFEDLRRLVAAMNDVLITYGIST